MKPFVTAAWTNLINITYEVPPELLEPYLPKNIEPDLVNGKAFASLVPFDFSETRFLGWKIPFHVNFPEINFRFYVKYGNKRGVVFIKEFAPKFFTCAIANTFYNEHYSCVSLRSNILQSSNEISAEHVLRTRRKMNRIRVVGDKRTFHPRPGSMEHFFEERFYGFCSGKSGETKMFRVEHESWELYPVTLFDRDIDFGSLIGKEWEFLNEQEPLCVMLIKGSAVKMFPHTPLPEMKKGPAIEAGPLEEEIVF